MRFTMDPRKNIIMIIVFLSVKIKCKNYHANKIVTQITMAILTHNMYSHAEQYCFVCHDQYQ